jgi:hypothetical protein
LTSDEKRCKDCVKALEDFPHLGPPKVWRPVVEKSGGRCATHWRDEKKRRREANHERSVQRTYGLGEGEYAQLYEFQGGKCAICRRATGATRRLSVDHDHATGKVRGLLCRPCNTLLGHARDAIAFFRRGIAYLGDPPYKRYKEGRPYE